MSTPISTVPDAEQLRQLPGFLLRRCNQIFLSLFAQETAGLDITPAQFGALSIIARYPGLDQTGLTGHLSLDRSSVTKCVDRLEERGLIQRQVAAGDRRVRLLEITEGGMELLTAAQDGVRRTGERLLAPLGNDAKRLLSLLEQLADELEEESRVPARIKE